MLSHFKQIKSGHTAEYVLEVRGQITGEARVSFSPAAPQMTLACQGKPEITITPNLSDSVKKMYRKGTWRTAPCDIADGTGKKIGSIVKVRQGTFFSSNYYTELQLDGHILQIYEVGLGKEGMKYPIYDGNSQLAQVEKSPVVRDNLDEYTIYSLDEFGELAALVFSLFLDFNNYRNAGEYAKGKRSLQYVYTRRKEILDKYDPDFRSRC